MNFNMNSSGSVTSSIQIIPTTYSSANSSCLSTTSNSLSSSPNAVDRLTSSASSSHILSTSQPIHILQRQMSTSNDYSDENHHNSNEDYSDSSMSDDYDPINHQSLSTSSNGNNTNTSGIKMEVERGEDVLSHSNGNLSASRVNRFFPDKVVDVLNKWFFENQEYPYPDDNMTNVLAREANISAKQVRKWFANKRVRSNKCLKTTCRTKKDRRQTKSIGDEEMFNLNEENNNIPYANVGNLNEHKYFVLDQGGISHHNQQNDIKQNSQESPLNYQEHHVNLTNYFNSQQHMNTIRTFKSSHSLSSSSASSTCSSTYSPNGKINTTTPNANMYSPVQTQSSSTSPVHGMFKNEKIELNDSMTNNHHEQMHRSMSTNSTQDLLYNLWKSQMNTSTNFSNNYINKTQLHHHPYQQRQSSLSDLTNASLSCNQQMNTNINATNVNVNAAAAVVAAAVAQNLQNTPPYFLLNLIQNNSNMAFQAAITNRLLNLQTTPSSNDYSLPKTKSSVKRKTHLSNCFMNDSSIKCEPTTATTTFKSILSNQCHNSPDDSTTSLSCSPSSSTSTSPCSNASNSFGDMSTAAATTTSSTLINYYHQSMGEINTKRHQYEPQQQQQQLSQQQQKNVRKINFGDISDLIN